MKNAKAHIKNREILGLYAMKKSVINKEDFPVLQTMCDISAGWGLFLKVKHKTKQHIYYPCIHYLD